MDTDVLERTDVELDFAKKWNVVIWNDNVSTFEIVIYILTSIFGHDFPNAAEIARYVHLNGAATAGSYSFEIAETKRDQATEIARKFGYPLRLTLEQD